MFKPKSILALALCAGLFLAGCNDSDSESTSDIEIDIDEVLNYPYSELTPEGQKVKLENESMAFLDFGNAAKSSKAIEAFQNLASLLDEESVELIEGKSVNTMKETVEYADVYGVFTWNATKKEWDKTESTTELKFVFPAKKNATSNNATFSVKAVSSGITVTEEYEEYEDGEWIDKETSYYLPKSATGILTIDNAEAGKIEFSAEYNNNKQMPRKSDYKVTLADGYAFSGNFEKATENMISAKLEYNGDLMLYAEARSGIKIDEIIDLVNEDEDVDLNLYNKIDAYMKIMEDLVLIYDTDLENYLKESDEIDNEFDDKRDVLWDDWETNRNRYTQFGQLEKEESDKLAALFNKYQKVVLASTKDGFKIATIEAKSEKDGEYWNYEKWDDATNMWVEDYPNTYTKKYDNYDLNYYLRFNDNTLVDIDTYFSEGFSEIEEKWENFVKAFDR